MLPRLIVGVRKRLLLRLLFNGLGQALTAFTLAWLTRQMIQELSGSSDAASDSLSMVFLLSIIGFILIAIVILILKVRERVDAEHLGQSYVTSVRLKLFRRLVAGSLQGKGNRQPRLGVTMTRLITDLNSLKNWVSVGVARVAVAAVSIIGSLLALAYFSVLVALVATGLVLLCIICGLSLTSLLRKRVRQARRRRGQLASNLGEKILALASIVLFAKIDAENSRLRWQSRRLTKALLKRMEVVGLLRSLPDVLLPLLTAALMSLTATDYLSLGELIAVLLITGMMTASLRDLAQAWDYRQSYLEARLRLLTLLAQPRSQLREPRKNVANVPETKAIDLAFENVEVTGVCNQISAQVNAGERVLLTGDSGSGKSTLLMLAAGLIASQKGRVLLNGQAIRRYKQTSRQHIVQLVSPQLPLLRGTVFDNIAYGIATEDKEGITYIADVCGLTEENSLLPAGLDYGVEERGRNLSTSLCSRIALARALAVQPKLLLIDDLSFVLDSDMSVLLQRILASYDMTVIIASPIKLTAIQVDKIWQLQHGHIVENVNSTTALQAVTAR